VKTILRVQLGGIGKATRTFDTAEAADAYAVQCSLALGGRQVVVRQGHIRKGRFQSTHEIGVCAEVLATTESAD
jgi:hypothetical protein